MFKLLHVWSSKEATGNEKKNVIAWLLRGKKKFYMHGIMYIRKSGC